MLKIGILIFYIFLNSFKVHLLDAESASASCMPTGKTLNCSNFDDFDKLDLIYYGSYYQEFIINPIKRILLKQVVLDSDLFETDYIAKLSNFDGFDLKKNFFYLKMEGKQLEIRDSSFQFTYSKSNEIDCHLDDVKNTDILFYRFKNIQLGPGMNYKSSVCPIIFKQKSIETLEITELTDSNPLIFTNITIPDGKNLDATIKKLVIKNSEITLDTNLINEKVFERLEHLVFSNKLKSIKKEIFDSTPLVKILELNLDNMDEFLKDSGVCKLLRSMDLKISNNKNRIILILNDVEGKYDFSKTDLCDSYSISSERLVPIVVKKNNIDCPFSLQFLGLNKDWSEIDCKKLNLDCGSVEKINKCIQQQRPTIEKCNNGCNFELIITILIVFASIIFVGFLAVLVLIVVYFCKKMNNLKGGMKPVSV